MTWGQTGVPGDDLSTAAAILLLLVVLALLAWWLWHLRTTQYGRPAHTTDAMWWLWQQLQALEPSSQLGGTFASKPGYHNYRYALPSWDYSVTDPPDRGGSGDVCGGIDWTFPDAQAGRYGTISTYTKRLIASGRDPADPRLDGWRECYGQADTDGHVEGYDFRYDVDATSDSSHLWHIHLSESRELSASYDNKRALLSVLRGESVAQWLTSTRGDGAVLLTSPFDDTRLDLLWVGPGGTVMHWWGEGVNALWSGGGGKEDLGGTIMPGTLTASWDHDASHLNIAGLGAEDGTGTAPPGCGQYWAASIARDGTRSGWGSVEGVYGPPPGPVTMPPATYAAGPTRLLNTIALCAVILACAVVIATFVTAWVAP